VARKGAYTYDYPRPDVSVDGVLFRCREGELELLLIRRRKKPYKRRWTLPGGFIEMTETLEHSVRREIAEETGIRDINILTQIGAYGDPKRDPRGRVISVAFLALCPPNTEPEAGDDAADARWFPVYAVPEPLAFDHDEILADALAMLTAGGPGSGRVFGLLPKTFTREDLGAALCALYGDEMSAEACLRHFMKLGHIRRFRGGRTFRYAPGRAEQER
jgi:8-oxo-dGTP diphosphatase